MGAGRFFSPAKRAAFFFVLFCFVVCLFVFAFVLVSRFCNAYTSIYPGPSYFFGQNWFLESFVFNLHSKPNQFPPTISMWTVRPIQALVDAGFTLFATRIEF